MSDNTQVLPVALNDELAKAVAAAVTPEDLRAAILAEAEKQSGEKIAADAAAAEKAVADKAIADKAAADAAAAASAVSGYTRTEVIGGREFTFEAASELELERMVANAYRVAYAVQPKETVQTPDPAAEAAAAANAAKLAEAEAIARVELEQKFRAGTISASEYIKQSGAVKEYLASEGLSVDALKDTVTRNENSKEVQSWAEAAEKFKNSPAGEDWPGGEKNQAVIGNIISANPELLNAVDKVAAMTQAYAEMKRLGILFPYENKTATPAAAVATVPTEAEKTEAARVAAKAAADKAAVDAAAAALPRKTSATASSLFGRSSGVASTTVVVPPADAAIEIPADASPAEILDAWKKAQIALGKDPNAEFMNAHRANRL